MNEQDYELLSQHLDQELDDDTTFRLEQRLSAEPDLQDALNRLGNLDNRLRQAYAGTDKAPKHILDMLRPTPANVVAFPQRRRPAWQYAVAASLIAAAGLVLAPQWQAPATTAPSLASVLETTPSMADGWKALADGREMRPVLSFKAVDGTWCREYLVALEGAAEHGVACRDDGRWNTRVLAPTSIPGDASDFRPAGAGDSDVVTNYLAEKAEGIALNAAAEKSIISSNWSE
jgi:hypothetical protein